MKVQFIVGCLVSADILVCPKKMSVCNHQLNCILGLLNRVKSMQSPSVITHSKHCCILESSPDATVCLIDSEIWAQINYMYVWAKRCEGDRRAMGTSCCLELYLEQIYKLSSGKKGFYSLITRCVIHMNSDLYLFYFLEVPNNVWDLGFENIWGSFAPGFVFSNVCGICEKFMTSLCRNFCADMHRYALTKCRYVCE